MKNLQKKVDKLLSKDFSSYFTFTNSLLFLFSVSIAFFFQAIFQNKVALPADALVAAHIPWTEIKWDEYPAGIPIKNLAITDAFSQFYPWRSLVGDFWREGKVPLWNNYMFSGTQLLATLHSSAVYPLNFVYKFFSDTTSWNILVFMQVILSLIFMFLFLKEITRDNIASVFGAVAFAFSGYMIAWLEFATGGHAGLWLPLLLLLQYKFSKSKEIAYLCLIPLVIFMILTAGDFQVPFYSLVTYVLFSLFLVFNSKDNFRLLIYYIAGLVLGVLLSLIQWLPTLELFSQSIRTNDPYISRYFYGIYHWENIANFLWPDFFGNVVTRNYWGNFDYHEYSVFVGSISIALIVFRLFAKKDRLEMFFLTVLLVSLLFLFPTPLAFLPFKFGIPGLGTSAASRILFLVGFCLSVLAALGLSRLKRTNLYTFSRSVGYLLFITTGVVLGIGISLFIFKVSGLNSVMEINLKVALKNIVPSSLVLVSILFIIWLFQRLSFLKINNLKLVVTIILLAEMLRFGWKNTSFSQVGFVFPETKITTYLSDNTNMYRIAGGIPLNLFMPFGVRSVEGYDPIYPSINSVWYSYINSGGSEAPSGRYGLVHNFASPLLDLSSVRYVVDYKKNPLGQLDKEGSYAPGVTEPRYIEVFSEGRVKIFENTEALPIAWLSDDYVVMNDNNEMLKQLAANELSNKRTIILSDNLQFTSVAGQALLTTNTNSLRYDISYYEMGMNEVNLKVDTNKESLLFLSQTFDPGWEAYVNGVETTIYNADYLYQSIVVPEGKSTVQFKYMPKSFRIGRNISLITLSLILFGLIVSKVGMVRHSSA